jgi:preprotein translocase subunit SecA
LLKALGAIFHVPEHFTEEYCRSHKKDDLIQEIIDEADLAYEQREQKYGPEIMRQAERFFLLSIIDRRWVQHIDAMDELREGVQLQAAGQRDPLVSFRTTAGEMFSDLQATIRHEVVHVIYQFEVQAQPPMPPPMITAMPMGAVSQGGATGTATATAAPAAPPPQATPQVVRASGPSLTRTSMGAPTPLNLKGVGRNDPCPCGSGRKFKQCHGRG